MILPLHNPDRRTLLTGLVAAPAVLKFGHSGLFGSDLFKLGVASGDPAPDGFVIWTRLSRDPLAPDGHGGLSAPIEVVWEISADDSFRRIVTSGRSMATAQCAHSLNIEVGGLNPNARYFYRFTAQGQQSPVGIARTTPLYGAAMDRLRLAVASCSHWERGYFSAYGHMADENPDLTLFLGDYIYEYSLGSDRSDQVVRPYNLEEATDLAGYRNRYALHRTDPDLRRLHAVAPCLAIWDDHEVQDDYSGIWSKVNETAPSDFLRRRAAAYLAFFEAMPVRRSRITTRSSLYRQVQYGTLAQLFMLDGRQYRSRQPCSTGPQGGKGQIVADSQCPDRADPSRTFLGFEQERWLYDGLARSEAQWSLLGQNLVMAGLKLGSANGAEPRYWTDTWDGYPAARARLTSALHQIKPNNPVVLSGDYHSFWTNDIKLDSNRPDSPTVATEFVGTSITSPGPTYDGLMANMSENPQVKFFDSRVRGYMAIDIQPDQMTTRYRAISDVKDPRATVQTLNTWVVEAGRPGAVPA